MKISLSPKAEKQLKKLNKIDQIAVAEKIRTLGKAKVVYKTEKLRSYKNIYRVRVGDVRIVFKKTSKEVYIISIGHRKDIYKLVNRLFR